MPDQGHTLDGRGRGGVPLTGGSSAGLAAMVRGCVGAIT